jgi:hypothetical protein
MNIQIIQVPYDSGHKTVARDAAPITYSSMDLIKYFETLVITSLHFASSQQLTLSRITPGQSSSLPHWNGIQCANAGKQSCRFLTFLGSTKRNVMVCALSWFCDEAQEDTIIVK